MLHVYFFLKFVAQFFKYFPEDANLWDSHRIFIWKSPKLYPFEIFNKLTFTALCSIAIALNILTFVIVPYFVYSCSYILISLSFRAFHFSHFFQQIRLFSAIHIFPVLLFIFFLFLNGEVWTFFCDFKVLYIRWYSRLGKLCF